MNLSVNIPRPLFDGSFTVLGASAGRDIMKSIRFFVFLCCVLGLPGALWFYAPYACAHNGSHDYATTASEVVDDGTLESFVRHAAAHLSEAETFSETLGILNEFRNESGDWNDGSTYLVLLTGGGGVYVHAKNRELEDQDWSGLADAAEGGVGQQFLGEGGGIVEYNDEAAGPARKAYAHPFTASAVPFGNPSGGEQFVLVGGFVYEPPAVAQKLSYEELAASLANVRPTKDAREIGGEGTPEENEEELKVFVEEAIFFFTAALVRQDIDPVRLRTLFRLDGGPWRHVSTYIYIMDEYGNVIFNGANRNIEQTDLSVHPEVGDTISELLDAAKMQGGGFVEYNWENPAVEGDGEQTGGPGGSSPKLGYTKTVSPDKDNPLASVYVFGSGLYLGQPEDDDSGCALSGTGGAFSGLLPLASIFFLALFLLRRSRTVRRGGAVRARAELNP